jgi:hypothetical protein
MTATRAFWRTDGTYASRTAAERRRRAIRWHPFIIERGLALRVVAVPGGYAVQVGANDARLLRVEGGVR